MDFHPGYERFSTEAQWQRFVALHEKGSERAAAEHCRCSRASIRRARDSIKKKAAAAGFAPESGWDYNAPIGFSIKGVSDMRRNEEGLPVWYKADRDKENLEQQAREFYENLAEGTGLIGRAPSVAKPVRYEQSEIFNVIPMGDPHFGMYAWAEEAGEDFDLDIAEERMRGAIDRLVDTLPPAEFGLFINLGDFFHSDNNNQRTSSGNILDGDGRHAKIAMVGQQAMVYAINKLRTKHEKVTVWNKPGNHDPHAYLLLQIGLAAWFRDQSDVDIEINPSFFSYLHRGRVLIGSTHGHGPKMPELPQLMATDQAEAWGQSDFRYWYVGHIHHKQRDRQKEHVGAEVETFNTLAGSDAWHHGEGYRSKKSMQAITHHATFGEYERHTCNLKMLEAA